MHLDFGELLHFRAHGVDVIESFKINALCHCSASLFCNCHQVLEDFVVLPSNATLVNAQFHLNILLDFVPFWGGHARSNGSLQPVDILECNASKSKPCESRMIL